MYKNVYIPKTVWLIGYKILFILFKKPPVQGLLQCTVI